MEKSSTSSVRVRLVFEDRKILTKQQRSSGLNRSWLLVDTRSQRSVSDVAAHIVRIFGLANSCPDGVSLSMEGFVLPPFESTSILNDKEIICVKKKGDRSPDAIEAGDAADTLDIDIVEKQPIDTNVLLLANEEFDHETGGYHSESEEDEEDKLADEKPLESPSGGIAVSKKRKASTKLHSSKKKKHRVVDVDGVENELPAEQIDKDHGSDPLPKKCARKKGKKSDSKSESHAESSQGHGDRSNTKVESPTAVKRSDQLENDKCLKQTSPLPGDTKKVPSRSARRKKAKRKWMREMAKISKTKHNWKSDSVEAETMEAVGQSKGLLHWKQLPEKSAQKNLTDKEKPNMNGRTDTQAVPIVIRPGHIRFEPLEEDPSPKQVHVSRAPETFRWNGITSKKKGQKWGTEKFSSAPQHLSEEPRKETEKTWTTEKKGQKWGPEKFSSASLNLSEEPRKETEKTWTTEKKGQKWGTEKFSSALQNLSEDSKKEMEKTWTTDIIVPVNNPTDFEKLPPLSGAPKEGDVIAYKLLELASDWTPVLSSFRVGKVVKENGETGKIFLVPVPEYPTVLEKVDESRPDISFYAEDGTLEIDFTSLSHLRIVERATSDPEKAVSSGVSQTSSVQKDASSCPVPGSANGTQASTPVNGEVSLLDQVGDVLNAKKAELTEEKDWSKLSSGRNPWSYRALRGSALGPTMAMLRNTNNI